MGYFSAASCSRPCVQQQKRKLAAAMSPMQIREEGGSNVERGRIDATRLRSERRAWCRARLASAAACPAARDAQSSRSSWTLGSSDPSPSWSLKAAVLVLVEAKMALQDDNFTTQVLLTSVLGTPSSSINGASISARSERAALEQAAGPSAAQHYTSRLSGKRVQLLNPDRPAPRGEGHRAALAHRQLAKKDRRAKKVLKALRSGARQNSVSIATRHSTSKGKEKAQEDIFQGTQAGARPLSRSQRRKLGLDELDENLRYVCPSHYILRGIPPTQPAEGCAQAKLDGSGVVFV